MSREKELAKNTVILTIGKICTQFVQFLLLPLYTTLLVPEEFGVVDLFNTYITLLVPIFNWQLESGLFRFMIDCRSNIEQQKKIFSTVIIFNIIQSVVYLIFYSIAQGHIQSNYKVFLAIDVFLNIFLNTLLQFPRGKGNNTSYAIAGFISASSTVILNVVFIAGLRMGAYGMFIATVLAKIITLVYLIINQKVWDYFSVSAFDKKVLKDICKYSLPLVPNQLSWWVIGVSDRTIVSYVLGITVNGIYSVANKFSSIFIAFYNIFNMSWTETVSLHMFDEDRDEFLSSTINSVFTFFSTVCIGVIAVMPFVFPIMVNQQYARAYQQIPILMIAVLFQVVVGLYSVVYVALKMSTVIAKTSFCAAAINITTNLILVQFIGLYAASVSTLIAYATMAIYRYIDVKKYVNVKLDRKTILSTTAMGTITIISYYYNNILSNIVVMFLVMGYAFFANKNFLKAIFVSIRKNIKVDKP